MTKKLKESKGHGHIGISNVGSGKSECITLTYSMSQNLKSLDNIQNIISEMDEIHNEESKVSVTMTNYDTDEEDYSMKYQIKTCANEKKAREIKSELDTYVNAQGGQTTLDEQGSME